MPSSVFSVHQPTFTRKLSGDFLASKAIFPHGIEYQAVDCILLVQQLASTRALLNRLNKPEVQKLHQSDSHDADLHSYDSPLPEQPTISIVLQPFYMAMI
jgi:hypothetical protein